MTINHIDQLTQWWDEAEEGVIEKGDTVINRSDGETTVYVATERARRHHASARILARAPKPKPAWHDAVAVTARCDDTPTRYALLRDGDHWINVNDENFMGDELEDVTPLIEAKVTDEMVLTALQARSTYFGNEPAKRIDNYTSDVAEYTRAMLTAALGLETT